MNSIVNLHHSLFLPINFPIVLTCDLNSCLIHLDTCMYLLCACKVFLAYSAKLGMNDDVI